MALTVTTDLTVITTAETATGWTSIGSGSGHALEPDFYVQGSNCISRAVSNATKGMVFDNGAGIDFTTGTHKDKLVYIWMRVNTPQLVGTRAASGVVVRLCTSSATTNYRQWAVDGNDTIPATDGWICYVIDPQSAGTTTSGSYNAASVRFFGGLITTTTTAKGQNLGIDQISYGRGEIYVSGTTTTTGEGFKEIADVAFDAAKTNAWGIITVKRGILYCKGKIIIGNATANTTFSSRGETVVWETPGYYNGTNVVQLIPNASVGSTAGLDGRTTYNGIAFIGGSGTTTIDIGVLVGTDAGRSGASFQNSINNLLTTPARTTSSVAVDNSTMALSLYATTFQGFEGSVDLTGTGMTNDDCFSCTFNGCGRLDSNMEIRNCNIINSVATTTDGAYIWDSSTNLQKCVFANNSRAIVFESATGSPFTFTSNTFSGNTFDVRNESTAAITINIVGGTTPTYEDIGGGSATTLVINPVVTSVNVTDITDASPIQNARVLFTASDGTGEMPYLKATTITRSGAVATATCTAHGLVTSDYAVIKGATDPAYNGVFQVTRIDANSFSYTVAGTPTTPATGTITTTGAPLYGLTDVSGDLSITRSWSGSQPITGRIRRATTGTYYKTGSATGTISNTAGFSVNIQLIPDQ